MCVFLVSVCVVWKVMDFLGVSVLVENVGSFDAPPDVATAKWLGMSPPTSQLLLVDRPSPSHRKLGGLDHPTMPIETTKERGDHKQEPQTMVIQVSCPGRRHQP